MVDVSERCSGCGTALPEGHLRYVVSVRAVADFDGILPEVEGNVEEEMNRILKEAEAMDPSDLEKDVHEELAFFLCKSCKEEFMKDPLRSGEALIPTKGKSTGLVH